MPKLWVLIRITNKRKLFYYTCICINMQTYHYGIDFSHYGIDFSHYGIDFSHYGIDFSHYGIDFSHYYS